MKRKDRLRWIAILTGIPVLYTVALFLTGYLEPLENRLLDFRYQNFNPGHSISEDVVLVEIDETTLRRFKDDDLYGKWPWRRQAYLPIIEFIQQGAPAAVLFDITFFEKSLQEDDDALGEASGMMPNLSHAVTFLREAAVSEEQEAVTFELPEPLRQLAVPFDGDIRFTGEAYNSSNYPVKPILEQMHLMHSVAFDPDSDNVGRRMRPFFAYDNQLYPSLALTALHSKNPYTKVHLERSRVRLSGGTVDQIIPVRDGKTTIHWYDKDDIWKNKKLQRFSLAAILESKEAIELGTVEDPSELLFRPWELQDKIIIIGATASATHDIKTTPYGKMPGVFLHALYLSNLLEGHHLKELPAWSGLLLALLLTTLAVVTILYARNIVLRVAIPAAVLVLFFLVNFILFQFDISLMLAPFIVSYPIAFLASVGLLAFMEGRDKSHFKSTMSKYLSPAVLNDVISRQNLTAEVGERRVMSVMFTDIRSFTTMSEGMDAGEVVALLNEYLSGMVDVIFDTEGTLDKFIGDAIMAFWNAPVEQHDHALRAVKAGLRMLNELDKLNQHWVATGRPEMHMGVGVNSGEMIVGNIGSAKRLDYTVIGDNVNLGSRLESLTKNYGVAMIVSESTAVGIRSEFLVRPLDLVAVKGKTKPVAIFEPLMADQPGRCKSLTNVEYVKLSEQGFAHYSNRQFQQSIDIYQRILTETDNKDIVARTIIDRCLAYQQSPPPENWDGSFIMTTK